MGRLLFPLLPLYSFMHRSILLSSFHSCLYNCSQVHTIICGCLPCRSVDSRHFHVAFACISVAEIRTAYCTRCSDELTIQHVFWDASILWTWPSHRKRRWLSSVYMLKLEACSRTSVRCLECVLSRPQVPAFSLSGTVQAFTCNCLRFVCAFTRRRNFALCVSTSSRTMLAFGINVSCSSSACSTLAFVRR